MVTKKREQRTQILPRKYLRIGYLNERGGEKKEKGRDLDDVSYQCGDGKKKKQKKVKERSNF